jgi:hypothetical protein
MSRSDGWSIAATLIVAGIAYFIGGQRSAYGCIALGFVIALYLLSTHKKVEPTPASASASATAQSSPQMAANPSMNQSTHIHLDGSERLEGPKLPPPKPRPPHNLQLHSCRMIQIDESRGPHGEMGGFHSTDDQSKPNAAVVYIRNKSKDSEVSALRDVRAALIFRDSGGKEIGSGIHQAVWVDNHLHNPSFDLEETKCVILVVMKSEAKILRLLSLYIREQMTSYGLVSNIEAYALDGSLNTVELILLSKNVRVMEPMVFEFFLENDNPGIRLVSDDE